MFNLLKADLLRLKKDTPLKVIIIIMLAFNFLSILFMKILQSFAGDGMDSAAIGSFAIMGLTSIFAIANLGLYITVIVSMFSGKDFSQNTIRGKIIGGNSRFKVFTSAFIVNLIIGLGFYLISAIEGVIFTLIFFGAIKGLGDAIIMILLTLPLYASFIAVMTFISYALRSQMLGIVINVLIVVILPAVLSLIGAVASSVAGADFINTIIGYFPYQIINTITYGTVADFDLFVDGALKAAPVLITFISSIILAAAAFFAGYAFFKNSDIK